MQIKESLLIQLYVWSCSFQVISAFFKTMLGSTEDRTANSEDFKNKLEKFQSYMPDTKFLAGTAYV